MKKSKRIIIIGGIAAGTSAAAKSRRKDEEAEIVIYEKDEHISYGTCGLPYFVSDRINNLNKILINTPDSFSKRFNIIAKISHEVLNIDPEAKKIRVKDMKNGQEFEDHYDKLILATGSVPIKIKMEGYEAENVFVLKTIEDAKNIKKYINVLKEAGIKKPGIIIIGGGFIGLELIEAFIENDFTISIIEKMDQLLPVFDWEIIEYLENYLIESGIEIIKNAEASKLVIAAGDNKVESIETIDGKKLKADMVFFGIGTRPNIGLARDAGIEIGKTGAIAVDNNMQTSIEDIYAAGDCCECRNLVSEDRRSYNLASIANRQGRIAGYNAAGGNEEFDGSIVTSIIKVLDVAVGKTGLSLKEARALGIKASCIELHYGSHAGYYPGAEMMHSLVIFEEDTRKLLGFEAIGKAGIDKRVDIISTAIKGGLKIEDLANIDLAYQPAFGSAKDSLNILGMIAENLQKNEVDLIDIAEIKDEIKSNNDITLLDVRTEKEYKSGHIEGAVHIPIDDLRENLDKLDPEKKIIIYCRSGYRAYLGLRILKNLGFSDVKLLNGSYLSWEKKI